MYIPLPEELLLIIKSFMFNDNDCLTNGTRKCIHCNANEIDHYDWTRTKQYTLVKDVYYTCSLYCYMMTKAFIDELLLFQNADRYEHSIFGFDVTINYYDITYMPTIYNKHVMLTGEESYVDTDEFIKRVRQLRSYQQKLSIYFNSTWLISDESLKIRRNYYDKYGPMIDIKLLEQYISEIDI